MKINNIIIAGKNNIAVDICKFILSEFPSIKLWGIVNRTDTGVDGKQRSFLKFLKSQPINIINIEDAYDVRNSVFLSLEYDRIVNPCLFDSDRLFNIHFSKLPAYRGVFTSAWPILNGEEESGVTLHKIDTGIDTGDIILQKTINICNNETASSLYSRYISEATQLIIASLPSLITGCFNRSRQSIDRGSYYSTKSINYDSVHLDFRKPAVEVERYLRAFTFRCFQLVNFNGYYIFGSE